MTLPDLSRLTDGQTCALWCLLVILCLTTTYLYGFAQAIRKRLRKNRQNRARKRRTSAALREALRP